MHRTVNWRVAMRGTGTGLAGFS